MNELAKYRIGMVIPLRGPGGIFGPSCMAVSEFAVHELNKADGICGREAELVYIDGGQHPHKVAAEVRELIDHGRIDAVTGWHISSVRQALAPIVRKRIPYVYTSLYEGGEANANVYCSGETPERQIFPAMEWLRDNRGIRKWFVIGSDYVWPLRSHQMIQGFASALNVDIVSAAFVGMGQTDTPNLAEAVARSECDGVLTLLVGQDSVNFNRHFAALGLQDRIVRFSPLMEENMLLASGEGANENLYSSAAYFRSLATEPALGLVAGYVRENGIAAPALNNMAESCYQGISTLASLARRAGSVSVETYDSHIDGLSFQSPRGRVRFRGNQASQQIYLARADAFDFDVIATL